MSIKPKIPSWKDKILFTPGPLTTSRTVKQAGLRDLGSRDYEFIRIVADIRQRLLEVGGVPDNGYEVNHHARQRHIQSRIRHLLYNPTRR